MSLDGIVLQGNLLTRDFVERLQQGDVPGGRAADYDVAGRLEDRITSAWNELQAARRLFKVQRTNIDEGDAEETYRITKEYWVRFIFDTFRYGHLKEQAPLRIEDRVYQIRFQFQGTPIQVVPYTQDLDEGPDGTARGNPHSRLQEYLNRAPDATWGILTNGLKWRILRDNAASTRPAYIEFDVEGIMDRFDEFSLWWRIAHASRITGDPCWLEKWMREADREGVRALDALRKGVEDAIEALGVGFLKHPKNQALREALETNKVSAQDYFHQVLRLVYRLLFLFVTEDRALLLDPKATPAARKAFTDHYSTQRLRRLAREMRGSQHHDQFESLKVVMDGLKSAEGCRPLALPPLNSALWSNEFIPHLDAACIRNGDFLRAVRSLSRIKTEKGWRNVNHGKLGPEELGSVYESLLELSASVNPRERSFTFVAAAESERRTTGTHYTPTELIDLVLNHALDPLLDEAMTTGNPEKALLDLTVCDPTCGSGHFLVAAAHRIARRLATARTGEAEPAPADLRHALRDVVGRCIYGVDINPMTIELCKFGLWLEALEPGKPLTFLDHHIKCGNALIGAFPEYLEKGIPSQAYTPRDGIDKKQVCRELVSLNKQRPMTSTTLTAFRRDSKRVQEFLSDALNRIDQMLDQTVEQILRKDAEYERAYKRTVEYARYKQALDAWCAAFTYTKVSLGAEANITNGQLIDFLDPGGQNQKEILDLVERESSIPGNQFFHWVLEFPSVFQAGGFGVVLGNPPYMGGQKVSGTLGHHYNAYLRATTSDYMTAGDLAGAFLLRFARLRGPRGRLGIVTTNSISKGETRQNSLERLIKGGLVVAAAFPSRPWLGEANVLVAVVVLGTPPTTALLNGVAVEMISSRLDTLPESEIATLRSRIARAFQGDILVGPGFLVDERQATSWIERSPRNREALQPFLTGEDLLQSPNQGASRWAICFQDWSMERAGTYAELFARVEREVRPFRADVNERITREKWWLYKRYTRSLRRATAGMEMVIVKPRVSETPLFLLVKNEVIFSDATVVIAESDWATLGVLNSGIHEVWYRKQGSGMKQDLRYTPSTCFETFPVPAGSAHLESRGKEFYERLIMAGRTRGMGLTTFWNLVNSPDSVAADVEEIRRLRNELTVAVAEAFDLKGIDFRFGFYKDHAARDRYTMHPEAAEQVYLALVALNAKQAAEEAAAGVTARRRPKGEKTMDAFEEA